MTVADENPAPTPPNLSEDQRDELARALGQVNCILNADASSSTARLTIQESRSLANALVPVVARMIAGGGERG